MRAIKLYWPVPLPRGVNCLQQAKPDLMILNDGRDPPYLQSKVDGLSEGEYPPVICIVPGAPPGVQPGFPEESSSGNGRWGRHGDKDGWLVRAFSGSELLSLVRLLVHPRAPSALQEPEDLAKPYQDDQMTLDFKHRHCTIQGKEIRLSRTEFRLMAVLASCADEIVGQRQLLSAVWGSEYLNTASGDIVRQAVRSIRIKLSYQGISPDLIGTVRGRGYTYRSAIKQGPVPTLHLLPYRS